MIDYLKGLGFLIGILSWIVLFHYGYYKITKEKLWNSCDMFGIIAAPFLFPLAIFAVAFTPYIIGKELF